MTNNHDSRLSIVQINYAVSGGAGIAAFRLHKGLLSIGQDSKYLVKEIDSAIPTVFKAAPDERFQRSLVTDHLINKYYIYLNRTSLSNTYFSFSYPGYDLSKSRLLLEADILNLHWTEDFLSPVSLNRLFSLKKPVVWTLHDQKPFSGGCHYSAGCRGYQDLCSDCPQLLEDPFYLPNAALRDKLELFKGADLTIVTPSKWLAQEARNSTLFKDKRIEVIPNSLEVDVFSPTDKKSAKKLVGIDPDKITIMFGTCDAKDDRKGFKNLTSAIDYCLKNAAFKKWVDEETINIICVGNPDDSIKEFRFPLLNRGYINDPAELAKIYNASDIFVLPSLEDNLPNTMLEAMACGTPVIAFETGGMPDVIINNKTGKLVEYKNNAQLGDAILELISDPVKRQEMSFNASNLIHGNYKLEHQAKKYLELYHDLLKKSGRRSPSQDVIINSSAYGENTGRNYSGFLQFSLKELIKRNFNLELNNAVALKILAYAVKVVVKIFPYSKLNEYSRMLK